MSNKTIGLILSGGGARAAYQVGVLKAICEVLDSRQHNPFPIVSGTSAGAINAAVIACYASRFHVGIRRLEMVWRNFHCHHVFRSDLRGMLRNTGHWLNTFLHSGHSRQPISLLDNKPLALLLRRVIPFERIESSILNGDLTALSITASSYTTGENISFYQGVDSLAPWYRSRRRGVRSRIHLNHLLASSAIPMVFPAIQLNREYFGDGSMRQLSPISPALHLGANKIVVIGVDRIHPVTEFKQAKKPLTDYPSIADITGHILDSAFTDSLESDLERLMRINKTINLIPPMIRDNYELNLQPIETLVISPSQEISDIAAKYFYALPKTVRFFFNLIGASDATSNATLSYLLFEAPYTQALIQLGYNDALDQYDAIKQFFEVD